MTINKNFKQTTDQIELTTSEETFQWTKQWYPVAVVEFLDSSQPHSHTVAW